MVRIDKTFWKGRKVFLTGHTGFKGSWLTFWLLSLGAEIYGYSLEPDYDQSLFNQLHLNKSYKLNNFGTLKSEFQDIRDFKKLKDSILAFQPEIVLHLAAQPLVKKSYLEPLETWQVNVQGSLNLSLIHISEPTRQP